MASIRSNFPEVAEAIRRLPRAFVLTRSHRGGRSLGEAALDLIAQRIQERALGEQTTPDDVAWKPNAPGYAASAAKAGKPIGVLHGRMLDTTQLRGVREIEESSADMTYGVDDEARQEMEWFSEGNGRGQPAREVYGFDEKDEAALDDFFEADLGDTIRELGGA